MIEHDDKNLVKQVLKGEKKAFEGLVDKYQKPIFNAVYRMVQNFDDAEDITQRVFIKAFESLDVYNIRYKFFSWIYRIAINESINFINQKKRKEELSDDLIFREKTPEEEYIESELNEKVQEALMFIDPNYRILIVLKHFQDCSYKEMSYILDIPEKKVKSRLFTARGLLKDVLITKGTITND